MGGLQSSEWRRRGELSAPWRSGMVRRSAVRGKPSGPCSGRVLATLRRSALCACRLSVQGKRGAPRALFNTLTFARVTAPKGLFHIARASSGRQSGSARARINVLPPAKRKDILGAAPWPTVPRLQTAQLCGVRRCYSLRDEKSGLVTGHASRPSPGCKKLTLVSHRTRARSLTQSEEPPHAPPSPVPSPPFSK